MPHTTSRLNASGSSALDTLSTEMSDDLELLVERVQAREMGQAVLLFATGFHPLAFVLGQGLHALAPIAGVMGWDSCTRWAALLSHRDGPALIEKELHDRFERNHT